MQLTDPINNETYVLDSRFVEGWRAGARYALLQVTQNPLPFVSHKMHELAIRSAKEACVTERDRMIAALAEEATSTRRLHSQPRKAHDGAAAHSTPHATNAADRVVAFAEPTPDLAPDAAAPQEHARQR